MNATVVKGLLLDAFYQVLDNKIFRLLLVLDLFLVALAFVVSFRPDEIQVLFGAWSLNYGDVLRFFTGHDTVPIDVQGTAIQGIQSGVVETLCGQLGMVICLSATAFFVPRMLEKGAADIVFAKPVSRFALFLSRYVAGLLFVAILSIVLVVGMWLGFLVASGYNDPGFLWGAPTLIYLFGMLHAVSMAIGAFTRSTVASILFSIVFFMGSGCVHWAWENKEYVVDAEIAQQFRQELDGGETTAPSTKDAEKRDDVPLLFRVLGHGLDGLHYVLPKTRDADVITRKLRRAIEGPGARLTDSAVRLAVTKTPEGFERVAPPRGTTDVDLSQSDARWIARDDRGTEGASIELRRFARTVTDTGADGKTKTRRLNTAQAAEHVLRREREAGRLTGEAKQEKTYVDMSFAQTARWTEGTRERSIHVLTLGDWALEISESAESSWLTPAERAQRFDNFRNGIEIARQTSIPSLEEWYDKRFSWKAPLKFNIGFSIASTLLFTVLLLAIAHWKLARTDF